MQALNSEYYGDRTRWFIGVVEDISDPYKLGRIRVRIHGVHDQDTTLVPLDSLPWASVVLPVSQGGISGLVDPTGIKPGAQVFGFFVDGQDSQVPLVLGSIPYSAEYASNFTGEEDLLYTPAVQNTAGQPLPGNADGSIGTYEGRRSATANNIPLSGGSNEEQAFNFLSAYFASNGYNYPNEIAAGFVGNFIHEAGQGLPTDVRSWGTEQSYGIAQWNTAAGRFPELQRFANQNSGDWKDLQIQLRFVTHELESSFRNVATKLRRAATVARATEDILRFYEIPMVAVRYNQLMSNRLPRGSNESAVTSDYRAELNARISSGRQVYDSFVVTR